MSPLRRSPLSGPADLAAPGRAGPATSSNRPERAGLLSAAAGWCRPFRQSPDSLPAAGPGLAGHQQLQSVSDRSATAQACCPRPGQAGPATSSCRPGRCGWLKVRLEGRILLRSFAPRLATSVLAIAALVLRTVRLDRLGGRRGWTLNLLQARPAEEQPDRLGQRPITAERQLANHQAGQSHRPPVADWSRRPAEPPWPFPLRQHGQDAQRTRHRRRLTGCRRCTAGTRLRCNRWIR